MTFEGFFLAIEVLLLLEISKVPNALKFKVSTSVFMLDLVSTMPPSGAEDSVAFVLALEGL